MVGVIKNKLRTVRDEAEYAMLTAPGEEGAEAAGIFAACGAFLNGLTPEEARDGLEILPVTMPQRRGWQQAIKQFEGLL